MQPFAHLLALLAVAASALTATPPAAAEDRWSPLQETGGNTLAVALDDGATVLVSVGGADEATVYDQRRAADGMLGAATQVMSVEDAEGCRPVDAATAIGNVAVAVECRLATESEEPPTVLVELVWTGDDGWAWNVQEDAVLGSVDYSPQGQYAVFATDSEYGRPHHVTSHHADLGWRDLTRRELGLTGDDLVAPLPTRATWSPSAAPASRTSPATGSVVGCASRPTTTAPGSGRRASPARTPKAGSTRGASTSRTAA